MNLKFVETTSSYIKEHLPQYLAENTRYFAIVKNKKYVGVCGFVEKCVNIAEAFIFLFPEYYFKVLSKKFLLALIDLPFELGYKEVWVSTKIVSLIKVFKKFSYYGVKHQEIPPLWDEENSGLTWFKKGF